MSFVGIDNVNEFYGEHYLNALLAGDLRGTLTRWREQRGEEQAPPQLVGALHRRFFKTRDLLERTSAAPDRLKIMQEDWAHLLHALGFETAPVQRDLLGGVLPLLCEVRRENGTPLLWWLPSIADGGDDTPLLSRVLSPALLDVGRDASALEPPKAAAGTIENLVSAAFDLEEPPRFVLVVGEKEIVLAERARWSEQRSLRFDLEEILGRRDRPTLEVTACLLHKDSLVPEAGGALLDTLDDSSHKHAYGVSEDLKFALRECIELIGNEAARQIADRAREQKKAIPWDELADPLSRECLRYMYRLLFLFYIEARPELGYAPMDSEAYARGYSLERLRDLEDMDLLTPEARDGTYLHESIALLSRMLFDGATPAAQPDLLAQGSASLFGTFELRPLRSHLFDPARTPNLQSVRFPNHILQTVVRKMSLSRGRAEGGRAARPGRVSYATLGINQLGAVYEALLSFRGFFAREDLFEVKPAGDDRSALDTAYFVNDKALVDYEDDERVFDTVEGERRLRRYAKGTFIYRMAGRDRQKSASYYTPKVLTEATVKYALKELLEDDKGNPRLTSEEVLALRVLEPAVGSAAFLNEAVDQLAEAYLHRAQQERGERIPHDRYGYEKQRVKMYLADNNVFGIDLNPVAIELAEVSLWLNAIFGDAPDGKGEKDVFVPWFGSQLACGNSLVGARRQVFSASELSMPGERASPWLTAVPARVPLGQKRPDDSAWHFLLPDRGMATYGKGNEGAPIRERCAAQLAQIEQWKGQVCAPLDAEDREALVALSAAIERLWGRHVEQLRDVRARTTDPLSVYGRIHPDASKRKPTTTAEKDRIWDGEMASTGVKASSPYRRLKLAMDYWCALWFWPTEQAHLLPSREDWLLELSLLLDANVLDTLKDDGEAQRPLFAATQSVDVAKQLALELGRVDVPQLVERYPRLAVVQHLAERYRFFHWDLEFAEVFADRGGFDLVLGNPPWVKVEWNDTAVLADHDPRFATKGWPKNVVAQHRPAALSRPEVLSAFLEAHEDAEGLQMFLGARGTYPDLAGLRANLFKAFLPRAWDALRPGGAAGFLHPESIYDEPDGKALREATYPKLRRHYQFTNEFGLFPEVHHQTAFSINVYGTHRSAPNFTSISNLFLPSTIELCLSHHGEGVVPGIKNEDNKWETRGHKARIIAVDEQVLRLFASLLDESGTRPLQARLPAVHSSGLIEALRCFHRDGLSLQSSGVAHFPSLHFNETFAVRDGIIRRETSFRQHPNEVILSGPHFFVGNPLYKTPRRICTQSDHYDVVDLMTIPDDYIPRTNYVAACEPQEFQKRSPAVPWGKNGARILTTEFFRVAISAMIGPMGERTLQAAIIPRGFAHIDTVNTYTMESALDAVLLAATWSSLPADFFLKSTGSDKARPSLATMLPFVRGSVVDRALAVRALALNCVTSWYSELWASCWTQTYAEDEWSRRDARLGNGFFRALQAEWCRSCSFRTDYVRRQALVEIDVLVALALGIKLEQLIELFRAQFPVMRDYEKNTWFDRNGRIVSTSSRGLIGVGLPAQRRNRHDPGPAWADIVDPSNAVVIERTIVDDTVPGGPMTRAIRYEGPFDRCEREADYRQAWAVFAGRFGMES